MVKERKTIIGNIVDNYIAGDYPQKIKDEVMSWLADKKDFEEKDEAMWKVWNSLDPVANKKTKEAYKKISGELGFSEQKKKVLGRSRSVLKVAAVVIPVAVVFALAVIFRGGESVGDAQSYAMQILDTRSVEKPVQTVLEDGSEVWVNKSTVKVDGKQRKATVEGEAYFKIKKNEGRPFTVLTEHVKITVLGTRFEVVAHDNDSLTVITLYEGSINVKAYGEELLMSKGEKYVLNNITREVVLEKTYMDEPAWINEENKCNILLKEYSLAEIFDYLEDEYNVTIVYNKNKLPDDTITLNLTGNESIEDVMYLLSNISGKITYEIEDDGVVRVSKMK